MSPYRDAVPHGRNGRVQWLHPPYGQCAYAPRTGSTSGGGGAHGLGGRKLPGQLEAGVLPFLEGNRRVLGERGFAVLLFDKPGVNDSTGDWRRQSFDDRADEAVAAVRHLAFRGDIDPTRIGLMGHSQGGWIAQIARARSRDEVAFLILLSGLIGHAVGLFHGLSRTVAVLGAWYVFPDSRFVAIPAVIALIYLVSIVLLERRYAEVVARG